MKTCKRCGKTKKPDEFFKSQFTKDRSRRTGDGLRAVCIACTLEHERKRRATWSEKQKAARAKMQHAYARKWDAAHPHAEKAISANFHARRLGAPGRVSERDVALAWRRDGGLCWVCGETATQLDHVRPINRTAGGTNTADNIRPICRECNQKRSHGWHGKDVAVKEAALLKQIKLLLKGAR